MIKLPGRSLLSGCLAILLAGFLSAQTMDEMHVVEKSARFLEGEMILKSVVDANGDVCAGLKIRTDLEGLTFESFNGIVKVNPKPGEYTLFLQPGERVVKVFKGGYANLSIILADHGIKLVSGQTWEVSVTAEKKPDMIPVNIIAIPSEDTIFIDGVNKGVAKTQMISPGRHALEVVRIGYKPWRQEIDVSVSNTLFTDTLEEITPIPVEMQSKPSGAAIFIDNVDRGKTDKGLFLLPGKHSLRLTLAGYRSVEKEVGIVDGKNNIINETLVKNAGSLRLDISPADAEVTLNGQSYRDREMELAPGDYDLEVVKNGYSSFHEALHIEVGKEITKTIALMRNTGSLSVGVDPADAKIFIDREEHTGEKVIELSPDRHKIEVKKDGYQPGSETVTIEVGKTVSRSFKLSPLTGGLQLSIQPLDAEIKLERDGRVIAQWQGLKPQKDIPVGEYDLECAASGYKPNTRKITIRENKTTTEEVTLDPVPIKKEETRNDGYILAEIAGHGIGIKEYETFFARNAGGWDSAKNSPPEDRERFYDNLINYQLKLRDAYDRGLQDDPGLKSELIDYRSGLAATFLIDKNITEPGIRNLYEHRKEELRASHILIALKEDATVEETAAAYSRSMEIVKRLNAGESFEVLAKNFSDDSTAKSNFGDVYYFTGGQMTPKFENAAYAMRVGEISSKPVRTPFGYHIIKLTDRQPARGMMKVRHIMARFASSADSDTTAALQRIVALQDSLRQGANFIQLAIRNSEDRGSAPQGGDLGWFERRRWVQPFDEAAFRLHPGEVSPITRTIYGYHLILCDSVKPLPSFGNMKDELKKTYMQYRYTDDYSAYIEQLKNKHGYRFNEYVFNMFAGIVDTNKTIEDSGWVESIPDSQKRSPICTLEGRAISLDSAIGIMMRKPEYRNTSLRMIDLQSALDRVGEEILLVQEAVGLENRYPEFAATMAEYQDGIVLFKAEQLEVWNKISVTDAALHDYWSENRSNFLTAPRVKYQEIRVPNDTLALLIYDSLTRGADFTMLADRYNSDFDLERNHGICDTVRADTDRISRLADSIGVGEVSDPVINESGTWSIIKTLSRQKSRVKTFDEAGAEVSNAFQEAESKRMEREWLDRLKIKYPVKEYKENLKYAFTGERH